MELRHLRYFVAVAEEQNITRAARRLRVSQPPLSRQIRDLEHELGVALLARSPKSVRLTEAGRVFLLEARAVLARAEEATLTVRAVASGRRGEIHIGYAPSLTVELLPRALREFQEKNPGVRVTLHDFSTEELLAGLREGRLHLALMIHPTRKALKGLRFDELIRYPVCVAAHPAHPLARSRTVGLQALAAERLIGYTRRDYPEYYEFVREQFTPLGSVPQLAEEHDSATSLVAAIEAGRGVALVPQSFSCFAGLRLKLMLVKPEAPPLIVGVARRDEPLEEAGKWFLEAVKRAARVPEGRPKIAHRFIGG